MRKIKKINGFLVVKFNDREKREYEGTALGEYGVIDAEVYTGNLDIDRGAMEYDDADTLEVAVELARGLESEEDITDEPPTYTAAVETNESYTEEAVEPTALIEGWTRRLATQVKSKHYPDTDPRTAAHELYGFKMALHQIGFLPESEVITDPDTFGAGRLDGPMPRNPEELLAFVCDERCKNRAGHTQEELDAICAKCPLGQLYEDAEAQDLRIRERSERALQEHIEGVRRAEDTVTALLGGHEALAYRETGKESMKMLTQGEVNTVARVLQNMKDSVSRSVRDKRTDTGGDIRTTAQRRKIYALCEALGWNDDPRRIQGFVKRVAHVDRIEWLNIHLHRQPHGRQALGDPREVLDGHEQHRPRNLAEVHRRTHRLLQRPEQHQERRLRRGHVVLRVRQTDRVHLCKRHQVRLQ